MDGEVHRRVIPDLAGHPHNIIHMINNLVGLNLGIARVQNHATHTPHMFRNRPEQIRKHLGRHQLHLPSVVLQSQPAFPRSMTAKVHELGPNVENLGLKIAWLDSRSVLDIELLSMARRLQRLPDLSHLPGQLQPSRIRRLGRQ